MSQVFQLSLRCIIRLAISASAVFIASCSDNSINYKGLGAFATDCTSEDGFEGELEISVYEINGNRSANIDWYLGDYGGSWSAPEMVLSYDFISLADKKNRGFIKLSRDRPDADNKRTTFEGKIIFLGQKQGAARIFNVKCDTGYWD